MNAPVRISLIIVKNWKQPRCPSVEEWINKLWYTHTMEYCSAIKRNKFLIHATTWIRLQIPYQVKEATRMNTYCPILSVCSSKKGKTNLWWKQIRIYESFTFVLFKHFFGLFWEICNYIWTLESVCQFLHRSHLGFS